MPASRSEQAGVALGYFKQGDDLAACNDDPDAIVEVAVRLEKAARALCIIAEAMEHSALEILVADTHVIEVAMTSEVRAYLEPLGVLEGC